MARVIKEVVVTATDLSSRSIMTQKAGSSVLDKRAL